MTPEGWRRDRLPAIAKVEMGETIIAKDLTNDGIPVFSAGKECVPWGYTARSKKRYERGTIVLGARGTIGYPKLPDFDEYVSTQTTIAVTPAPAVDSRFLCAQLGAVDYAEVTSQQAVPMLTIAALNSLELLIPPLPEQRKIAAILSSVDEVIEKTEAVIEQLQVVKKAMMQELLTRGIPGRHTRFKQTEIGEIPEEWAVAELAELVLPGTSVTYGVVKPGPADPNGVLFVRGGDFPDGEIRIVALRTITKAVSDGYKRTQLHGGELLISLVGRPGSCAVVPPELRGANVARQAAVIRLADRISAEFARDFILSPEGQRGVLGRSIGSVQQVVNLGDLAKVQVPVPRPDEQEEIVKSIGSVSRRLAAEGTVLNAERSVKAALMSVLLTGEVRVTPDEEAA